MLDYELDRLGITVDRGVLDARIVLHLLVVTDARFAVDDIRTRVRRQFRVERKLRNEWQLFDAICAKLRKIALSVLIDAEIGKANPSD